MFGLGGEGARYKLLAEEKENDTPALKGGKSGVVIAGGWLNLTWSCCTAVMRRVLPWSSSASMSKPAFRVSSKRLFLPCLAYVGVQDVHSLRRIILEQNSCIDANHDRIELGS